MVFHDLAIERRYIVTKGNETFDEGCHIWAEASGAVMCREAHDWVDMNESPEALKGVDLAVDAEYYRIVADTKRKQAKMAELMLEKKVGPAKVIIAGSRTATDMRHLEAAIARFDHPISTVISGCARGADRLGERWAESYGIPVERYPADWDAHGKSAGYLRNKQMAEVADAAIVLWDGVSRGSKHMIEIAQCKGLITLVHYINA